MNPARIKLDRRLTEGKSHGNHDKELILEVGLLIPKSPLNWLLHNGKVAIVPVGRTKVEVLPSPSSFPAFISGFAAVSILLLCH